MIIYGALLCFNIASNCFPQNEEQKYKKNNGYISKGKNILAGNNYWVGQKPHLVFSHTMALVVITCL